jgi:predicted nucleic acid-binding protein
MYLLDTNIWLERLLGQPKANEVGQLLGLIPSDEIFITDFVFHSLRHHSDQTQETTGVARLLDCSMGVRQSFA